MQLRGRGGEGEAERIRMRYVCVPTPHCGVQSLCTAIVLIKKLKNEKENNGNIQIYTDVVEIIPKWN